MNGARVTTRSGDRFPPFVRWTRDLKCANLESFHAHVYPISIASPTPYKHASTLERRCIGAIQSIPLAHREREAQAERYRHKASRKTERQWRRRLRIAGG